MRKQIEIALRLARVRHWIKNSAVLVPLLFAGPARGWDVWHPCLLALSGFCLASSSVYAINDLMDRKADRFHPAKRTRPLAAGEIRVRWAWLTAGCLGTLALVLGWVASPGVFACLALYLILNLLYDVGLRRVPLIDVICVATGFVLRVLAGGFCLENGGPGGWLLSTTFFVCLCIALGKRANELAVLPPEDRTRHRATLSVYKLSVVRALLWVTATVAALAFFAEVWVMSTGDPSAPGRPWLLTALVPVVVFGLVRFYRLSLKGTYPDQLSMALQDRLLQLTGALWLALTVLAG